MKTDLEHKEKAWLDNFLNRYIDETKAKKEKDEVDHYEIIMAQSIVNKVGYLK